MLKWLLIGTGALVALVLLAAVGLLLVQRSILYPCRFRKVPAGHTLPPHAQRLWITHDQGRTPADYFPASGASAETPAPLVLFAHGNGDLIEDYADGLPGYTDRGVSVLLVEYRGCGSADGAPTMTRILDDHLAFAELITQRPEVDADAIVYHGRSMGGGIVAEMTRRRPPAALVLESTYTGITDFARRMAVPAFMVLDPWDVTGPLRWYAAAGRPVLISHARGDTVIPWSMSQTNRAAAPGHRFWESDRSHVQPMPDTFFADVVTWLREHAVAPAGR